VDEQDGADPGTLGVDDPWRASPVAEHWAPEVPRARTADTTGGGFGGAAAAAEEEAEVDTDLGGGAKAGEVAGGRDGAADAWAGEVVGGRGEAADAWAGADEWADAVAAAEAVERDEQAERAALRERRAELYVEVQHSPAFAEVRDRYRRFVFPTAVGFVTWYLLYVVAATTAPGLMVRQVVGQLNVALVAGLAQFATTFLLTWAFARHARRRGYQAALELRWTLATWAEQ
jgi:uncharacterized membrane protein (DUF485 family)